MVTDRAWTLLAVVDELMPAVFHNTSQYANNRIEADHGRLKSRLRPMRGLNATTAPAWSCEVTRSRRTCDAATTNLRGRVRLTQPGQTLSSSGHPGG